MADPTYITALRAFKEIVNNDDTVTLLPEHGTTNNDTYIPGHRYLRPAGTKLELSKSHYYACLNRHLLAAYVDPRETILYKVRIRVDKKHFKHSNRMLCSDEMVVCERLSWDDGELSKEEEDEILRIRHISKEAKKLAFQFREPTKFTIQEVLNNLTACVYLRFPSETLCAAIDYLVINEVNLRKLKFVRQAAAFTGDVLVFQRAADRLQDHVRRTIRKFGIDHQVMQYAVRGNSLDIADTIVQKRYRSSVSTSAMKKYLGTLSIEPPVDACQEDDKDCSGLADCYSDDSD